MRPPTLCNVCNRFGHLARDCRSKLRTCYVCGANNHFMRDRPEIITAGMIQVISLSNSGVTPELVRVIVGYHFPHQSETMSR